MVFYRKYRPQKLSELDSQPVRERLTIILSSKEIAHAFLFSGPKGLGKTSAARIVAKAVNCERRKDLEPCNHCSQCVSITNGTNLDVLEIDGASNRGIDEIRELREKIKLAPAVAHFKVYIVDEVHMLTTEAFNALLKTLEEPPHHVLFILCTTDMHKVPQTIQSRCFNVGFSQATLPEITRCLKRIIRAEHIKIDEEAVEEIAKGSDGSFRDASKLLEVAVLQQGRKKITKETILTTSGNSIHAVEFVGYLHGKDAKGALRWLQESIHKGLNVKVWLEDLLAGLHSRLLRYYNIESGEKADVLEDLAEQDVKKLITLFTRAHQEMKTAVIPQLPAELAIIEYCLARGGDSLVC